MSFSFYLYLIISNYLILFISNSFYVAWPLACKCQVCSDFHRDLDCLVMVLGSGRPRSNPESLGAFNDPADSAAFRGDQCLPSVLDAMVFWQNVGSTRISPSYEISQCSMFASKHWWLGACSALGSVPFCYIRFCVPWRLYPENLHEFTWIYITSPIKLTLKVNPIGPSGLFGTDPQGSSNLPRKRLSSACSFWVPALQGKPQNLWLWWRMSLVPSSSLFTLCWSLVFLVQICVLEKAPTPAIVLVFEPRLCPSTRRTLLCCIF